VNFGDTVQVTFKGVAESEPGRSGFFWARLKGSRQQLNILLACDRPSKPRVGDTITLTFKGRVKDVSHDASFLELRLCSDGGNSTPAKRVSLPVYLAESVDVLELSDEREPLKVGTLVAHADTPRSKVGELIATSDGMGWVRWMGFGKGYLDTVRLTDIIEFDDGVQTPRSRTYDSV